MLRRACVRAIDARLTQRPCPSARNNANRREPSRRPPLRKMSLTVIVMTDVVTVWLGDCTANAVRFGRMARFSRLSDVAHSPEASGDFQRLLVTSGDSW